MRINNLIIPLLIHLTRNYVHVLGDLLLQKFPKQLGKGHAGFKK